MVSQDKIWLIRLEVDGVCHSQEGVIALDALSWQKEAGRLCYGFQMVDKAEASNRQIICSEADRRRLVAKQ